jgi:hypothetical protein
MSGKKLILNLRGGLGNQLFGMYAAIALEDDFGIDCEIHTHGIDLSHGSGKSDATAFQYGRNLNLIDRRKLSERVLSKMQIRKLDSISSLKQVFQNQYFEKNNREKTLVELSELLAKSKTVILDGYFQDFSYFGKVTESLPVFTLDQTSSWLESQKELAISLKPIMIHIRLGDYRQNGLQILTKKYFNDTLLEMSRIVNTNDVWVFSDSPDEAKAFLDKPASKQVTFFNNDQKSTETLMLMREGGGLICSNSTFSYWAGRTGSQTRPVIYPKRFSQIPEIQIRSIPKQWISYDN